MASVPVVVGEGGMALFVASRMSGRAVCEYLAGPASAPDGTPLLPLADLPPGPVLTVASEASTLRRLDGVAHEAAPFEPLPAPSGVRVIAVTAPATGCGKSWLTRRVARGLRRSGVKVAVARHPMVNLALWNWPPARVIAPDDEPDGPTCLREEVRPLQEAGVPVVAGLDAAAVLESAGALGSVVVWDAAGASPALAEADFTFVVVDPLRPAPLTGRADAVVISKVDAATPERVREAEASAREAYPGAEVILADLPPQVSDGPGLMDKSVVCVEDAPSLVLGGLKAGAAALAARRFRCGVVDPRPFAVGAVAEALATHDHIGPVVPSLGRTADEQADFAATIRATPGDVVLWGSPASPDGLIDDTRPVILVRPELMEVAGPPLQTVLAPFLPGGSP